MGGCFVPRCNHRSERDSCKFFNFPKDPKEWKKWVKNIRRADREPGKHSRICSCHFKDAIRSNAPTLFPWNVKTHFQFPDSQSGQRKHTEPHKPLQEEPTTSRAILEAENYFLQREKEAAESEQQNLFGFKTIEESTDLIGLYTGLPHKEIFYLLLDLCQRFTMTYHAGWQVTSIEPADQLFMTLMKLRSNTSHLDLADRFGISTATVSNVVLTWTNMLHKVLYKGLMGKIPSVIELNKSCLPSCIANFTNSHRP